MDEHKTIKYLTEFTNPKGIIYGWHIYASSWEEAQQEADKRGIGEVIIGYVIE